MTPNSSSVRPEKFHPHEAQTPDSRLYLQSIEFLDFQIYVTPRFVTGVDITIVKSIFFSSLNVCIKYLSKSIYGPGLSISLTFCNQNITLTFSFVKRWLTLTYTKFIKRLKSLKIGFCCRLCKQRPIIELTGAWDYNFQLTV